MLKTSLFYQQKFIAVAVVYFLISTLLLVQFGVNTEGEAQKVIENANRILNGRELFNGVFGYSYIFYYVVVALVMKLSLPFFVVGCLQIILSFVAAVCLYKMLNQSLENNVIAFVFFMIYLLCFPVQKWNFFLYSESVHTSLVIICFCSVLNWFSHPQKKRLHQMWVLLLLVLFSRPVGLLFIITFFIILMVRYYQEKKVKEFYVLLCLHFIGAIILLNSHFTAFFNPDSFRRMEIICQVPLNKVANYEEYNRQGIVTAFTVIRDEVGFGEFFKNGLKKIGYFFGMYRTYYSWLHNLVLIGFTFLYPFALIGVFSKADKKFYYAKLFAIIYLLITTIGIFFTCDEWSNRFIAPAFPFICILAAAGISNIYTKIKHM